MPHAGLVPAVRLADNVDLEELAADHVQVGTNPSVKIGSLVAGMIVGANGIDGMDLLRHGAIPAGSGLRRRWGYFCGLSPMAMCVSSPP